MSPVQALRDCPWTSATEGSAIVAALLHSLSLKASRQHLRSAATRQQLLTPPWPLSTFGRRASAVAGPTSWNSLFGQLRMISSSDSDSFKKALKTIFFAICWLSRICPIAHIHSSVTLTLTLIAIFFAHAQHDSTSISIQKAAVTFVLLLKELKCWRFDDV